MTITGNHQISDPSEVQAGQPLEMPSVHEFLHYLSDSKLIPPADLEAFLAENPHLEQGDTEPLIEALQARGFLNPYQIDRLLTGRTFGLVLGNYRVVDHIGAGGMGVVYKAEHIHMKRVVAIKVLVAEEDRESIFLQRFHSEMQAMAVLRHPNIVLAFDAGEVKVPNEFSKMLRYLVMEYVTGSDLEQYVLDHGPLPIHRACDLIRQAASGLRHAHEHGLVHRDIKPSNLIVTCQDEVKILDFGLARLCRRRCTEANTMLGTVDYMAPEQARDARSVDIRADIYGLGGVLYWLLTGQKPFPGDRPVLEELLARQKESPVPLRRHCPDVPLELEAIVCQMMASDPNDRYPTPLALISAMNAFLEPYGRETGTPGIPTFVSASSARKRNTMVTANQTLHLGQPGIGGRIQQILLVSQDEDFRSFVSKAILSPTLDCVEVSQGDEFRQRISTGVCDLVILDASLPHGMAEELCHVLRAEPPCAHLKILLLASESAPEDPACQADTGADDIALRHSPPGVLQAQVRLLLRLKDAEDRSDRMAGLLLTTNGQLDQSLELRDNDLYQAQDVLIFSMAKMAEMRGMESGGHLLRMQSYVRTLAEEAARQPSFAGRLDASFIRMLERCVLLHDIGKVALPDHILLKPGRLDDEERSIMESHTLVGASLLEAVARQQGASLAFVQMAIEIARYHHERFDGTGYPDRLAGESIPLTARIVAVADVYDALRCKLVYKPGLTHAAARRLILDANGKQFDPALLAAFRLCDANFEQIFEQTGD